MDPGTDLVSALGWLGWLIGVTSGSLHFYLWRRDRKIGPAKEQLFEEALRDRKGQYSESQIRELTKLVGQLENVTKREVPRQARRVFIQNQLDVLSDTVTSSVKQHAQLSQELEHLSGERATIPPEIAQVIESTIVPNSVERSRQQRRLSALVAILLALALFPRGTDYILFEINTLLGDQPYPFGPTNAISYLIGLVVSVFIMFTITGRRFTNTVREHRVSAALASALFLFFWVVSIFYIGLNLAHPFDKSTLDSDVLNVLASISVVLFAVGIRVSQLLFREKGGFLATK